MLRNLLNSVYGLSLQAKNGEIGSVDDVYFDDNEWKIRYLVTDTSNFLPGRRVLISPASIIKIDLERKVIPVSLSKKEIERSPFVNQGLLPSRETEIELKSYYNWPVYWGTGYMIGAGDFRPEQGSMRGINTETEIESDLKSCNNVIGFSIKSNDNEIGFVHELIFDDETFGIRYLIINTRNRLPGKNKILLAVDWINNFDWSKTLFTTSLDKLSIKESPEYNPGKPVKKDYEERLFEYYNKPKY